MSEFSVSQGRLLFRNVAQRQTAMVGVLQLPPALNVVEGAAYILVILGGHILVLPHQIDTGLPSELVGQGIGVALGSAAWVVTHDPAAMCVRFCAAWPDANSWTVYGVSNHPMAQVAGSTDDHAWLDLSEQGCVALTPPCDPRGATMAQMLTSHPVWPGPQGELYALPQHELAWRPDYLKLSQMQAQCGAGEIEVRELQRRMAEDPRLNRIRSWGAPDPSYLRYLAALNRAGGIEQERPRTVGEHRMREALAKQCIMEAGLVLN